MSKSRIAELNEYLVKRDQRIAELEGDVVQMKRHRDEMRHTLERNQEYTRDIQRVCDERVDRAQARVRQLESAAAALRKVLDAAQLLAGDAAEERMRNLWKPYTLADRSGSME